MDNREWELQKLVYFLSQLATTLFNLILPLSGMVDRCCMTDYETLSYITSLFETFVLSPVTYFQLSDTSSVLRKVAL